MHTAAASRLAVLLFTDLVGSTELNSRLGTAQYAALLSRHDELFKRLITQFPQAEVLKDMGDGYFATFTTISDAVRFALRFQQAMHDEPWQPLPLRTRIGIHVGEVAEMDEEADGRPKLVGMAADLASRLMSLAQGGQILLTHTAFNEARQFIGEQVDDGDASASLRWVAHGNYLFKGYDGPVEVYEVGVENRAPLTPPPNNEKARRSVSAEQEETLGWRPAVGLEVPDRAGWTLQRKLGEGNFGEVWLTGNQSTRELRVFKFCFDAERLRSFKRELTFFRLLRDALGERKDIARLYEVRLHEPPFYLESEYANGGNLLDWAQSRGGLKSIPLETRLSIVARICDAVAAAHSVGVLHKDIKPSNILVHVDRDGSMVPRLSDFGIGLLRDRDVLLGRNITASGLTVSPDERSSRSGTPMYSPPEMLTNKPYTIQGDIYALGVLLYQMTVGDLERPLAAGWERDVEDELVREDIAVCVEGNPDRRLSSAAELARRLRSRSERAARRERERRAAELHIRRRRIVRAALMGVAACMLIAIVSVAGWYGERHLREAQQGSELMARDRQLAARLAHLDSLMAAADSQLQSKLYADAANSYDEAWGRAQGLKQPTLPAISGLLEVRAECPWPLVNRRSRVEAAAEPSPIVRVRMAPAGDVAFVGDAGGQVHVFELATARRIATLPIRGWGTGIAVAAKRKLLVIGGSLSEMKTFELGKWDQPLETSSESAFAYNVAISPDEQTMVSVEPSAQIRPGGKLYFWSLSPLRVTKTVAWKNGLLAVAYSSDGKFIATGDERGQIALWDAATAQPLEVWSAHDKAEVVAVAFTPDGKQLISGAYDKMVKVWDVASKRQLHCFEGHRGNVKDLVVSPDGRTVVSASVDQTLKRWDLSTGREVGMYSRHPGGAASSAFLPDGSGLVSGGENGRIVLWNSEPDEVITCNFVAPRPSLAIAPDGLTALAADSTGTITQFDLETGKALRSTRAGAGIPALAITPDGKYAIAAGQAGFLSRLDLDRFEIADFNLESVSTVERMIPGSGATTTTSTRPAAFNRSLASISIDSSGKTMLLAGSNGLFTLGPCNGRGGIARGSPPPITAAALSPDGKLALISSMRDLHFVDAASGRSIDALRSKKRIEAVAISADGLTAASGGYDNAIRLYNVERREVLDVFTGHWDRVRTLTFFPDGRTLVSGSHDNTVRLWDVVTRKEIRSLLGHSHPVGAVVVSNSGRHIVSADDEGNIRIWDLSRPALHRAIETDADALCRSLETNPNDAAALKQLGERYALRRRPEWAVQCLERAREGGATVSPLLMARCYWELGDQAKAQREFTAAAKAGEAAPGYLNLCATASSR